MVGARRSGAAARAGWVPQQHGAWAMLVVPLVVGVAAAGARPWHALLAATWVVGYLAFAATALLLKARGRARYRPAAAVYGGAALTLGVALLAARPALGWWAVPYAPLLAVALGAAWRRAERSWVADTVTVLAACLLAAVVATPAALDGGPTPLALTAGSVGAWQVVGALAAYFLGTVCYVKTMIRERGNTMVLVASVAWHALAAAAVLAMVAAGRSAGPTGPAAGALPGWSGWLLAGLFTLLTARAAAVPLRFPGARPMAVGLGEIAASAALTAALLAALAGR